VTHLRCGGIFSDSVITNVLLIQWNKFENWSIFDEVMRMKLRRTKVCQFFGPPCIYLSFCHSVCVCARGTQTCDGERIHSRGGACLFLSVKLIPWRSHMRMDETVGTNLISIHSYSPKPFDAAVAENVHVDRTLKLNCRTSQHFTSTTWWMNWETYWQLLLFTIHYTCHQRTRSMFQRLQDACTDHYKHRNIQQKIISGF